MYYFFSIGKMYCGWVKWLHRTDLAREPLRREPWYRQKSGDNTHHCRSLNAKAERLWFTPVDTDTIFWAGIQLRDGQQTSQHRTPITPTYLFTRNPAIYFPYFPEVDKTCLYFFGMLPGFLEILLKSGKLFRSAAAATKTTTGIIQLWFSNFRSIIACTLPGRLSKEMQR